MAIVAVIACSLIGFFAAGDVSVLIGERDESAVLAQSRVFGVNADPALLQLALEAHDSAVAPLKPTRIATLVLLSICCVLASVAALRLLMPRGVSRAAMRQLLVGAAFLAAFLRTVDGAQSAAIFRKVALAVSRELQARGTAAIPADQDPQAFLWMLERLPLITTVLVGLGTAIVTGFLLILAQFFRSGRAREAVDEADVFSS